MSDHVIVLKFHGQQGEYIDSENDASHPHDGSVAFTWRRVGQEISAVMREMFTMPLEEVTSYDVAQSAQRLMNAPGSYATSMDDARRIMDTLHKSIRRSLATGVGWAYVHSKRHQALVEQNEQQMRDWDNGILAPWERELLEGALEETPLP